MGVDFQKLGGSYLPAIETSADLAALLSLDEALWAVTSAPVDALCADEEFLRLLDDDANGRIRTDEVRRAISWILRVLKDRSGLERAASELALASLNLSDPDGAEIAAFASKILADKGLPDAKCVSLELLKGALDVSASQPSSANGLPAFAKDAASVMALKSGTESAALSLDGFLKDAAKELAWFAEPDLKGAPKPEILPFGSETFRSHALLAELKPKIEEYFSNCRALDMEVAPDAASARFARPEKLSVDPLDAKAMAAFLSSAPLARPSSSLRLPLSGACNPLWREKLGRLSKELLAPAGLPSEFLTPESWSSLLALFAPYEAWAGREPVKRDGSGPSLFPLDAGADAGARFVALLEGASARAKELKSLAKLRKALLLQANLLEFCENFATLKSLFNPERGSMIQAGRLVMAGRHFNLATRVSDIDAHKRVAVKSDICVMYLELSGPAKGKAGGMKIAVAATSGFMRDLYVGKNGVFFTRDGAAWDAKVVDLLSQPVSFAEALRLPFYKAGEFMGRQADRFFSTKSKELEAKGASVPAPAPQPAPTQSAFGGSMLLMGGGVGLAALGSSFAYIAQTFDGMSLTGVCAAVCAALFIFGAPILAVSIYKLWRRNVAMYLEAGGWALNAPLRMSRKMGAIFTNHPGLPADSARRSGDLIDGFSSTLKSALGAKRVSASAVLKPILCVLFLILAIVLFFYVRTLK